MSKIDEFSAAIGALETEVRNLIGRAKEDRDLATGRHIENTAALKSLDERLEKIEPVVKDVAEMKPQVAEVMLFKGRLGAVITIATALVMGAITLIWQGIQTFGTEIKALLGRLF